MVVRRSQVVVVRIERNEEGRLEVAEMRVGTDHPGEFSKWGPATTTKLLEFILHTHTHQTTRVDELKVF